jgi:hypothetical protein
VKHPGCSRETIFLIPFIEGLVGRAVLSGRSTRILFAGVYAILEVVKFNSIGFHDS